MNYVGCERMTDNYYITKNGLLIRKENTLYFVNKEMKKAIPINQINSIYLFGNVTITSGAVKFLFKHNISAFIFNKYGYFVGAYYPSDKYLSGRLIVKQVEHYISSDKRSFLARAFVRGAAENMARNCERYNQNDFAVDIRNTINTLNENTTKITEIMNIEGRIRDIYYQALDKILPDDFAFIKRTKRPPKNRSNAMISFGNSILYTIIVSEIYQTQANPTISYLHEPFERRFSLSLDISELFKPIIVDRLIISLIRRKIIQPEHFNKDLNSCLLNSKGKKIFISYFDKRLKETVKHKKIRRNVSYRRLIRLEIYKLIKHLLDITAYQPFVVWW